MDNSAFYGVAEWLRPAQDMWAVTPHDSNPQTAFRALWIGTTGALSIVTARGNIVTLPSVPAGWFNVSGSRVRATGTTASNIFGIE